MTVPTDFDSFAFGFDLTEANYSTPGSGGGTFTNLVSGQEAWTAGSNTPSFTTKSDTGWSLEGMDFNNSVNDLIQGDWVTLQEATILVIASVANAGAVFNYFMGGLNTATNTFALWAYGGNGRCGGNSMADNAQTSNSMTADVPFVLCGSYSPVNETLYCQLNDGTVATDSSLTGSSPSMTPYFTAAIGAHRTTYIDGWIARALVFSRALHYRDNANLQSLIETEMAKIGL